MTQPHKESRNYVDGDWWAPHLNNTADYIDYNAGDKARSSAKSAIMTRTWQGNTLRITDYLWVEQWIPHKKASDADFDVFFDARLDKLLKKSPVASDFPRYGAHVTSF